MSETLLKDNISSRVRLRSKGYMAFLLSKAVLSKRFSQLSRNLDKLKILLVKLINFKATFANKYVKLDHAY